MEEKEIPARSDAKQAGGSEIYFIQFISSLYSSCMFQLGKIMNPITGKVEKDLAGARATIEMLRMMQTKTEGNLSAKEKGVLMDALANMQMNYVDEVKKEQEKKPEPELRTEEGKKTEEIKTMTEEKINYKEFKRKAISRPLVEHIYTADPSAHLFEGKIYIYPSHDIDAGISFNDNGDHFGMRDYHVLSMESPEGKATDHGVALDIKDVPWAERQMWAPDAACKDGKYYLFFPAKDHNGLFRIGVAIGDSPVGPFKAEPEAIRGSYSIDPAVLEDDDGSYYMYWGGLWGGQLQKYRNNKYAAENELLAKNKPALGPRVACLDNNLTQFAEEPRGIQIFDENGVPLTEGDNERRYFEGPWMHKYNGKYYLSYSTGDTHFICYATGDSPYGPFKYRGKILNPVVGWTTHHSILQFKRRWYLFYHDSVLSKGVTHLRSVKVTELFYNDDGTIQTINPYKK